MMSGLTVTSCSTKSSMSVTVNESAEMLSESKSLLAESSDTLPPPTISSDATCSPFPIEFTPASASSALMFTPLTGELTFSVWPSFEIAKAGAMFAAFQMPLSSVKLPPPLVRSPSKLSASPPSKPSSVRIPATPTPNPASSSLRSSSFVTRNLPFDRGCICARRTRMRFRMRSMKFFSDILKLHLSHIPECTPADGIMGIFCPFGKPPAKAQVYQAVNSGNLRTTLTQAQCIGCRRCNSWKDQNTSANRSGGPHPIETKSLTCDSALRQATGCNPLRKC